MASAEEIKRRIDIVEFIGESVALKRAGRNFTAPCPFHQERTPSFIVTPERQTWHCFGACSTGGDVFTFVMRRDGVEFGEALRMLAARAGVELQPRGAARGRQERSKALKEINLTAANYYRDALLKEPSAAPARDYLERRGLDQSAIEDFRLGFMPQSSEDLERRLRDEGHDERLWVAAGLFRRRDDGSTGPMFRGRLIIPIQDERSDYIGFGARALDDSTPKYLNTPQTEIFEKRAVLYAINRARDAIREQGQAVIVEGYMDVIAAHQHGFKNVVASMGTALTEDQVASLTRLAGRFVLALDADAAGDEATLRSLESSWRILDRPRRPRAAGPQLTDAEERGPPELRVMDLPRGKDPDDIIRESPELWEQLVVGARPVIDYVFETVTARFDTSTAAGKQAVTQRLAPLVRNAPNVYEQSARVARLAQMLRVGENMIRLAIGEGLTSRGVRRAQNSASRRRYDPFEEAGEETIEEYCLASLLHYPELWEVARGLGPEHFFKGHTREIFGTAARGIPTESLRDHFDEALQEELDRIRRYDVQRAPSREREEGLEECVRRLERRLVLTELEAVQSQYGPEIEGTEVQALSDRTQELNARLKSIDQRGRRPA